MKDALQLYTWRGLYADRIAADAIKSRSAATERGPFGDDNHRPVYWVRWGTRQDGGKIPPYFRHWPKGGSGGRVFPTLGESCAELETLRGESKIHKKAKEVCVRLITRLIAEKREIPWVFANPHVSDFPLSGNLLSEVTEAQAEYVMDTPFGENYRFDVALIHKSAAFSKPQVFAAIEFELSNALSIWKVAICKAMGFPIVTIELEGLDENDITEDWLLETLQETTKSNPEGRRRNFFFVHSMLYPVYVEIPQNFRGTDLRHRYLVFATDADLNKLQRWLTTLRTRLKFDKKSIIIQPLPNRNELTRKTMEHEGSMAGHDWATYNDHCYVRISLDCPLSKSGPLYLFHLVMARCLTSQVEALVGYKYMSSAHNMHPEEPCWMTRVFSGPGQYVDRTLIPKHLSQPIKPLKDYLEAIEVDKTAVAEDEGDS